MNKTLGRWLPSWMPGSSRMYSIRIRLMSVTGLIWIAIIVLTMAGAGFLSWQTEIESWRGRQGEAARRNAADVAAYYERANDMLGVLGRFAEAQLAGAVPGSLDDLLREDPAMLELLVLGPDGRILANAYQDRPVLADMFTIAQSRWFQDARNGKAYRGNLQLSSADLPYLVLARPTQAGNVAAARVSMNVLHDMVSDIRFGGTGRMYVVDDRGQVIAHTDKGVHLSGANLQDRPEFTAARIQQGGEWFGEYVNFQGDSVLGATATVPGTDWIVLAEVDDLEAHATSRRSVIFLGAVMAALVCAAALLHARLLRRTVFGPIEQLRVSAERLGQGDFAFRTRIAARNEVGVVANAFDDMAQKLEEQRAAVEQRNSELEALRQIGLTLNSNLDLDAVLGAAVESALRLAPGIHEARIYLLRDGRLEFVASLRDDGARNYQTADDASPEKAAWRTVETGDVVSMPSGPVPASTRSLETVPGYLTGIPLKTGSLVVGALIVVCRLPYVPGENAIRALRLLSEQVAMVLDNARLYRLSLEENAARARAEQRYHAIIQDQTDLICRFSPDGRLTFVNDAYCQYFGQTPETVIGRSFMPLILEEDIPRVEAKIASLNAENRVVTYDHRVRMPDGGVRWQQWTDRAILDADGAIIEYQSVGRDITQQRAAELAVQASEERLRQVTDNMLDVITQVDMDGRILYASPSHKWVLGLDNADVEGGMIYERLHPDDLPQAMMLMAQAVTGIETLKPFTLRYRHANGQFVWMECVARLIRDGHGVPLGAVLASRDITVRMQMEEELQRVRDHLELRVAERTAELNKANEHLRESEERYALAMRGANDGLWDWNLKSQRMYFSSRWKSMLGCADGEIGDSPDEWFKRVHPDDVDRLRAQVEAHLHGHSPYFEHAHRVLHRDGAYRWMHARGLAVFDLDGTPNRMAGSQTDITARKAAEEQMIDGSLHDVLTGLPNRLLLLDRLGQALYRAKRDPERLSAVLFIDLDRFKMINDSLGHMMGDQLLIAVGRKLSASVSPGDTVARLGGDEFAILMDSPDGVDGFMHVADQLQDQLKTITMLEGSEIPVSASIGVAVITPGYERAEEILRDADTAMYRAKASGRARAQIFDADMHRSVVAQMKLEAELRKAVDHDLCVYYQPILAADDRRLIGIEALLRWEHQRRGIIGPEEFMHIAEETGLILVIGEQVLRTACAQVKEWINNGYDDLCLFVNLSARQFQDPNLTGIIQQVLSANGLPGSALKLELTESVVMENAQYGLRTVKELNAIGVEVVLDDFGIGYSSMGQLRRFPLRMLKIDRSFIRDMPNDPESEAIVRATIAMAHSLKLTVVAEGVENEAQLAVLLANEVDAVQGFLFSRPVTAKEMNAFLAAYPLPYWPAQPYYLPVVAASRLLPDLMR